MKTLLITVLVFVSPLVLWGQQTPQQEKRSAVPASATPIETQQINATAPLNSEAPTSEVGYMSSAQVKDILHKIWLAQFRINDLLSQVHPNHWKIGEGARRSFGQTMDSLHKALASQEDWRSQFGERTDSLYLGFHTYVAISAVLPRLEGVAQSVSQFETPGFGAQYSQAGLTLFDLQQTLQQYLLYLMRNQDEVIYATQTNLAACQSELGNALHGRDGPAKPMKNIAPKFKGHPRSRPKKEQASGAETKKD